MRRFLPWVNIMTGDDAKTRVEEHVKEAKVKVAKIEYKLMDRIEKNIECKVI